MDMYHHLKEKLSCCDYPLTYSSDNNAICIVCRKEYEVNVSVISKDQAREKVQAALNLFKKAQA